MSTNFEGPLAGLDAAIERTMTPAERMSDAKPPEQGIYRDHRNRLVHYKRHGNGHISEQVIGHHG